MAVWMSDADCVCCRMRHSAVCLGQLDVWCIVGSKKQSPCTFVLRGGDSCDVHVLVFWLAASFARGRAFAVFLLGVNSFTAKECEWSQRAMCRQLFSVGCFPSMHICMRPTQGHVSVNSALQLPLGIVGPPIWWQLFFLPALAEQTAGRRVSPLVAIHCSIMQQGQHTV